MPPTRRRDLFWSRFWSHFRFPAHGQAVVSGVIPFPRGTCLQCLSRYVDHTKSGDISALKKELDHLLEIDHADHTYHLLEIDHTYHTDHLLEIDSYRSYRSSVRGINQCVLVIHTT